MDFDTVAELIDVRLEDRRKIGPPKLCNMNMLAKACLTLLMI